MKGAQTILLVLCYAYLPMLVAAENEQMHDIILDITPESEAKQIGKKNIEIRKQYKKEITKAFIVKEELVNRTINIITSTIEVVERSKELDNKSEFGTKVSKFKS